MNLYFGHDEGVAAWVANRIPHMQGGTFGPCRAIAVLTDNGKMIAGVVYHDFQLYAQTVQLSMAADSPLWARKPVIAGLLHYPFEQLGVFKVWTATPEANDKALKVNKHIGFRKEAMLAHHFGKGNHAVICRMLRPEFKKLYGEAHYGQTQPLAATGT